MRLEGGTFHSLPFPNSPTDEKLRRTVPPMELPTQALKYVQQAFQEVRRYEGVQIQRSPLAVTPGGSQLVPLGRPEALGTSLCAARYSQQQGCTIPSPAVGGSKPPKGAGCQSLSMAQQSISHFSKSPGASLEYLSPGFHPGQLL